MGASIAVVISGFFAILCVVTVVIGGGRPHGDDTLEARKCIDADAISSVSTRQLHAQLERLTSHSTFFSIFRVALDKKCPFWADNGQCSIRECSVCNCAPHEIPTAWRQEKEGCKTRQPSPGNVDRSLPKFLADAKKKSALSSWEKSIWYVEDAESEAEFVDLRKNPEAYTAYTGAHANSIWSAIYEENCFEFARACESGTCQPGTCKEERVFYRLISGVHTSITAHLAKHYRFPDGTWGENAKIFRERIALYPERIKNLNVALAVTIRAIAKASINISPDNYAYVTGDATNDKFTSNQLQNVLDNSLLDPHCTKPPFDESDMFVSGVSKHRLTQFRGKFHNISKIMDCVGCEKCRLWGKLQFLGIGTALRILFEDHDVVPKLSRNQVIALVNLLHKLTSSALWVEKMEAQARHNRQNAGVNYIFGAALAFVAVILFSLSVSSSREKNKERGKDKGGGTRKKMRNEEEEEKRNETRKER